LSLSADKLVELLPLSIPFQKHSFSEKGAGTPFQTETLSYFLKNVF